jgi:hypothetical protein
MKPGRGFRVVALLVVGLLGLTACHRGGSTANPSLSQLFKRASQRLCGVESDVMAVVSKVSSGAISSKSDVAAELGKLKKQLDVQAAAFKKHGFSDLSAKVSKLSSAIGKLQDAVSSGSTTGMVAGATAIASAIAALPACPSVSPSA